MSRIGLALILCAVSALFAAGKTSPKSGNTAVAHSLFLKAREAEFSGDDRGALGFYQLAFQQDGKNRELCFLYLERLKILGSPDSTTALAKKCADLPGKPVLSEYKTLGEIALRGEDVTNAIRWYRAALAEDEDDGDALYVLAGLYENARDWDEYVVVARRLLPRLNYPATLVERQLQAYSKLDRMDDALSLLEEAWRATGRENYGQSLAAYYDARGMHRSLLKVARALADSGSAPEYQWLLARAYAAADRPDSALRLCERLLTTQGAVSTEDSANQGIRYLYTYLLFDSGRYQEAYASAKKLLKVDSADVPSILLWGSAALELRKSEARKILERARALLPLSPDIRARQAYADYVFKSPQQASERLDYTENSAVNPAANDSLTLRQALLLEGFAQGQLARQLDPRGAWERPSVYSDSVAARSHRLEAIARFEKVLAMDSGAMTVGKRAAQFELAAHLDRVGQRSRAENLLRELVRQDTANAVALNYLGYLLVENLPVTPAQLDESGRLLDRALALEPENGAFIDSKGWWQYRAGALDSALITLRSAAESIPSDPAILGHQAEVLRAQGRIAEACAIDRDVRRRDTGHAIPEACGKVEKGMNPTLNPSSEKNNP